MKTLFIDCAMGCAGDMLTAALLELHPDREAFLQKMNAVFGGRVLISAAADEKCGIQGTHVSVKIHGEEEGEREHHHDHGHHHHHTGIQEIMAFIDETELPEEVKEDAKAVYGLIARAESQVHGREVDQIHFHEVGSLDALADVLNVCALIHELAPEKILASPVNVGSGFVRCAHGVLPVPAPATELILRGVPVYSGQIRSELCTPTGAALLKHFVQSFGPMPVMTVKKTGYGTGKKDFEAANVVRVFWGKREEAGEQITELACNLDDMTPETLAFAAEELLSLGALDVYMSNILMKKGRPGVILHCLCAPAQREEMLRCIFKNTTTLGVRETRWDRCKLRRSMVTAETPFGPVRIKRAEGYGVVREKAEYEDLAALARKTGLSLEEIRQKLRPAEGEN